MLLRYATLLLLLLFIQSCHIGRFFVWNFADVNDYKKFPARDIAASDAPFEFKNAEASLQHRLDTVKLTISGIDKPLTIGEYVGDFGKSLSFLIIRNDSILYEQYFQDYAADSPPVPSFSVAKSFVSALVGFAVQEGRIKSVEEPVTNYFPEMGERDPRFKELTIEHLLNMRSGLKYDESSYANPFAPVARDYYGRKLEKYTLEKSQFDAEPDAYREYQSVNTQLLGLIVEKATGKTLPEYLEEKVWQPLGMEFPASWSYDSKAGGTTKAFCCLNAQARDFAKFGRLYLNNGRWEGKQLLDSAWVARSVNPNYSNDCYQYQWYSGSHWQTETDSLTAASKAPAGSSVYPYKGEYAYEICGPDFMAIGILGQYIYLHPEKNVIMVRQGKNDDVAYKSLFKALSERL
jgi:CubicO group peptidase (beta-lactamase class C family)